jgi:hypothetical protein
MTIHWDVKNIEVGKDFEKLRKNLIMGNIVPNMSLPRYFSDSFHRICICS